MIDPLNNPTVPALHSSGAAASHRRLTRSRLIQQRSAYAATLLRIQRAERLLELIAGRLRSFAPAQLERQERLAAASAVFNGLAERLEQRMRPSRPPNRDGHHHRAAADRQGMEVEMMEDGGSGGCGGRKMVATVACELRAAGSVSKRRTDLPPRLSRELRGIDRGHLRGLGSKDTGGGGKAGLARGNGACPRLDGLVREFEWFMSVLPAEVRGLLEKGTAEDLEEFVDELVVQENDSEEEEKPRMALLEAAPAAAVSAVV